jgi:hypothetical protein
MRPAQYTIRRVPPAVDRALRERARRIGRSLNEVAVQALTQGAGQAADVVYADLDGFFGSWVADPEVDRALADQRRVDKDLWK